MYSPGDLAGWVREDIRESRIALSRARLQHGENSPEHRRATAAWSCRTAVLAALAQRRGVAAEKLELWAVPALELLDAARAVRSQRAKLPNSAEGVGEFLAATAFLDQPEVGRPAPPCALPAWSPEPPGWAESDG